MSALGHLLRWLLTLALLVGVYMETGWATALCLVLIAARFEILDYNAGRLR